MTPNIIIKGNPIDYELTELLGGTASDFVALCFDGVQFESFGTPYDSLRSRREYQAIVDGLNDRTKKSLWPRMFENWGAEIRKQYGLPEETTWKDYRPEASWQICRVVRGYSQHLHVAIGLFEDVGEKIRSFSVQQLSSGKFFVRIIPVNGEMITEKSDLLPMAICKAVVCLLK